MFSFLDDAAQWWLFILLVLWIVFLFGGMLFGKLNADATHRSPRWSRMISSLILVIAAWSWYSFGQAISDTGFALLLAIGMLLGFVGDLFMAGLIPIGQSVLNGMLSFGLGHIVYIAALINYGNTAGLDDPGILWGSLFVWLAFGGIGWYLIVFRGQSRTLLHYAALPYALLLASTAGVATGLAIQMPTLFITALGAALFLLSDLLLAAQLFNGVKFRLIGDVVWMLYGPAQMLIVYSIGIMLSHLVGLV